MMKLIKIMPVAAMALAIAFTSCKDDKKIEREKMEMEQKTKDSVATVEADAKKMADEKMKEDARANSIASKAMASKDLDTLVIALKAAGLAEMMMEPGEYTVFAPTDNAFKDLPKGTLDKLTMPENKDMLVGVLQYHVVSGKVTSEDLANAIKGGNGKYSFKTVQGEELTAMMDGDQIVIKDGSGKKAQIVLGNIEASNGIVHEVSRVLMAKK